MSYFRFEDRSVVHVGRSEVLTCRTRVRRKGRHTGRKERKYRFRCIPKSRTYKGEGTSEGTADSVSGDRGNQGPRG